MAPAIGAAIFAAVGAESLGAVTVAGITGLSLSSVVGYAVVTAASLGAQMLLADKGKGKTQPGSVVVKQSLPNRVGGYGRAKVGGALFFLESNGADLFQGIVHGEGPWDGIEQWSLNESDTGIAANSTGGNNTALPWGGNVQVYSHLGTVDQTVALELRNLFPAIWTDDHRLKGLCYTVVRFLLPPKPEKNFQKVFPNGQPTVRVQGRLKKVYDPRESAQVWTDESTWAWSENPSVCILDYLTSDRGFGIPRSRINIASFIDFAWVCDTHMTLASGALETRYAVGGTYDLTEQPKDVLARLLATCDGELVPFGDGTIGIRGGGWTEPTVTLTDDVVLGYEYQRANDKLSSFNRLKVTFTYPAADWHVVEAQAWDDEDAQAVQGVLPQDLALPMVLSPTRARRLAKIAMHKGNPRHRFTLRTSFAGLVAYGERTLRLRLDELDLDENFYVTSFGIDESVSQCVIGLSSLSASAYEWNAQAEDGQAPVVGGSAPVIATVPSPAGIELSVVRVALDAVTFAVKLRATALAPTDQFSSYWRLTGRFRRAGDADWTTMAGDGDHAVLSDFVTDGETYAIEVAFYGLGQQSDWSTPGTITAQADVTPPGEPTGFGLTVSGTTVSLTWTAPNSANFQAVRVYRGATTAIEDASPIHTEYGAPSSGAAWGDIGLAVGIYRYWLRSINFSGVAGTPVGPLTATVS